jgi:hypothetical protein
VKLTGTVSGSIDGATRLGASAWYPTETPSAFKTARLFCAATKLAEMTIKDVNECMFNNQKASDKNSVREEEMSWIQLAWAQ